MVDTTARRRSGVRMRAGTGDSNGPFTGTTTGRAGRAPRLGRLLGSSPTLSESNSLDVDVLAMTSGGTFALPHLRRGGGSRVNATEFLAASTTFAHNSD